MKLSAGQGIEPQTGRADLRAQCGKEEWVKLGEQLSRAYALTCVNYKTRGEAAVQHGNSRRDGTELGEVQMRGFMDTSG